MRIADTPSVASRIELAFQSASTSTGTSFDYLVKTAARESSFNPQAMAKTSSATGLFQFVEATWLETVKEAGPLHGLEKFSDQIELSSSGKYFVSDANIRQQILDLRKDPEISSLMAGALTQKNAAYLERKIGREPTDGELYMAHFLGANGASKLIDATAANPEMRADAVFSTQASANKSIFYNRNGTARSMEEVYQMIVSKHDAVSRIAEASGRKSLRASGDLQEVAALPVFKPVTKPVTGVPLGDPGSLDHLAGDPAGRFAMQPKPVPPDAMTAAAPMPAERLPGKPLDLAQAASTPAPHSSSEPASQALPVQVANVAVYQPVDGAPDNASLTPPPVAPASRVLSAFEAAETVNPFEALFRTDQASNQAGVNPRFASAFAAVDEAGLYGTLSGASNQVAAQALALADQGGPLDLSRFLRPKADEEQKDLLPPA